MKYFFSTAFIMYGLHLLILRTIYIINVTCIGIIVTYIIYIYSKVKNTGSSDRMFALTLYDSLSRLLGLLSIYK